MAYSIVRHGAYQLLYVKWIESLELNPFLGIYVLCNNILIFITLVNNLWEFNGIGMHTRQITGCWVIELFQITISKCFYVQFQSVSMSNFKVFLWAISKWFYEQFQSDSTRYFKVILRAISKWFYALFQSDSTRNFKVILRAISKYYYSLVSYCREIELAETFVICKEGLNSGHFLVSLS